MKITHCYWQIDKALGAWPSGPKNDALSQLPAMIKRRLTPLGRQTVEMLYQASAESEQSAPIPWVVACQHADTNRKIRLLTSLANKQPLSPTDFSMSVHNAIIGTFSIATQNKQMHTAIAGSKVSFEMGLLEAFALQLDTKSKVGYLYYDALFPLDFTETNETAYPIICLAMILEEQGEGLQLQYVKCEQPVTNSPANNAISFVDYLKSNDKTYKISIPGGNILVARANQ